MRSVLSFSVRPVRVLAGLSVIIAILVVFSVSGQYARFFLGHGRLLGFIDAFDLDAEANVPTYFSCLQLLAASFLAGLIASTVRRSGAAFAGHWGMLSVIFAYLSLDEFMMLHEQLARLPFLPAKEGVFFYAWVIPGLVIVAVFGALYTRFFWALPTRSKVWFAASGALFVGGAIGVEMMGGLYASQHGEISFTKAMIIAVEETFEMSGVALFIYALLDYLGARLGEVRMVFGSERAAPSSVTRNGISGPSLRVAREGSRQE